MAENVGLSRRRLEKITLVVFPFLSNLNCKLSLFLLLTVISGENGAHVCQERRRGREGENRSRAKKEKEAEEIIFGIQHVQFAPKMRLGILSWWCSRKHVKPESFLSPAGVGTIKLTFVLVDSTSRH